MSIKSKAISLGLALAIVAAGSASAFAYDAVVKSTVNVRSGPSTHYHIIDKLWGGDYVEVDYCKSGWCLVDYDGGEGWVSKKFIYAGYYDGGHHGGSYGAYYDGGYGGSFSVQLSY